MGRGINSECIHGTTLMSLDLPQECIAVVAFASNDGKVEMEGESACDIERMCTCFQLL